MAQSHHLEANYTTGSPVSFPCNNMGLSHHGPFPTSLSSTFSATLVLLTLAFPVLGLPISLAAIHSF